MKKLVLALTAMIVMVSCSKDEVTEVNGNNDAIKFSAVVGNNTIGRAATYGLIDLAKLKLSADGFAVSTTGLATNMNSVAVKYSGSIWSYTGDYYWPLNDTQNVSFVAYAPAGQAGATLSGTGLNIGGYTPATTVANQVDLLYAAPANFNRAGSASGVALTFKHILTQVAFSITSDIPSSSNPTVSIQLKVAKGSGNYTGTASTSTWTTSNNPQTYSVFNNKTVNNTASVSEALLMLPQTALAGIQADVTLSINGVQSTKTVDLSTLPTVTSWDQGVKVTYSISFSNEGLKIKFADPTINPWTEQSSSYTF